jgi:hypothetical protein
MAHDLIAELNGYRAELAGAEQRRNTDRVDAVRAEIDRVTTQAQARIEQLLAQAENHEDAGADLAAAQARVEAKALAKALPEESRPESVRALRATAAGGEPPGAQNTAESTPREKAVTPRRRAGKES